MSDETTSKTAFLARYHAPARTPIAAVLVDSDPANATNDAQRLDHAARCPAAVLLELGDDSRRRRDAQLAAAAAATTRYSQHDATREAVRLLLNGAGAGTSVDDEVLRGLPLLLEMV